MKAKKALFYLLAALMGGCVPVMSLHPLYIDEDLVFKEKLLGTWTDKEGKTTWKFRRLPDRQQREEHWSYGQDEDPNNTYHLIYRKSENKGSFTAHLVKLDGQMFLDVYPTKPPCLPEELKECDSALNILLLVPMHTFTRIDFNEPQLKISITNEDKIEDLLQTEPNAVKHEKINDQRVILTASTKELQEFVVKYAEDDRLFPGEISLKRAQPAEANEPNAPTQKKHQQPAQNKAEQK